MDDLRELYKEVILDHGKHPRNFRHPDEANRSAHGYNPMCGDTLFVYLTLDEAGVITDCAFKGKGCAISKASASLMTEAVKGKTTEEAEALFTRFHDLLTGPPDEKADARSFGKLAVFSGVREFPVRVKCATLAWHTLHSALAGGAPASTE